MPDFAYIARELTGREVRGTVSANSEQEALASLAGQSLFPSQLKVAAGTETPLGQRGRRVPASKLATMYSQLGDLLESGVPLLRSLDLLRQQATGSPLFGVLDDVRTQVGDGMRLADAMRRHPRVFNELTVSMVRAGEEGGFLEESLQRVSVFVTNQEELKAKVLGAMIYPLFLAGMGTLIVTGILIFLVPKFEPIFERYREEGTLPLATHILLWISDGVATKGVYLLVAILFATWWLRGWLATEQGRWAFDVFRLKAWGAGPITRDLAVARFCRVLGTLLQNGVPILGSLRIAKDATGNRVLSQAIGAAAENISGGKSLARPLAASKQFPPDVMEMISVGEEANNLEKVLLGISDKLERHSQRKLELFVRLLEPVLLLLGGLVILFMAIAIMLPVLNSSSTIK
jgi:general secretion pathway protein F